MAHRHRVVVTGLGILAPNGTGVDNFWDGLLSRRSGIDWITQFDTSDFSVKIAGEVKGFDLRDYFPNGQFRPKRMGRHTQLALASTRLALQNAGIEDDFLRKHSPITIMVGVSTSAFDIIEQGKDRMARVGPGRVSSYIVSASQPHAVANVIAESLPVATQSSTISSACAAGLQAIDAAASAIRLGRTEMAIAGGADAAITPFAVASFISAGLLPSANGNPAKASRPFDYRRSGGVMAEGAGMIVLENMEHAVARGAVPLAELKGYGTMVDTLGDRPASGLAQSMNMALANSGRHPSDIRYICAHGPSDPILDMIETEAIKTVFGRQAYDIPVSSIKGVTGNPLSAAGPFQLAACAMAIRESKVPPTANYEEPDPQCDLDYVPGEPRNAEISCALINVHGMGGGNSSLIVERVDER